MKIKQFLIAVCIGTMFAACSSNEDYSADVDKSIVRLKAEISPIKTKAAAYAELQDQTFAVNEQINVYVTEANTSTAVTGMGAGGYLTYTIDVDKYLINSATVKYPATNKIDVYGLYPSTVTKLSSAFMPEEDQSTVDGYRASDLMFSVVNDHTADAGMAKMTFQHCLSKLVIKIDKGSSSVDLSHITGIQAMVPFNKVSLTHDQRTGLTVSNPSAYGPTFYNIGSYNTNGVSCIIPPQTVPKNSIFIIFSIDSVDYAFISTNDIILKPGTQHTLTLTIDNSNVKLMGLTITDWTKESSSGNTELN